MNATDNDIYDPYKYEAYRSDAIIGLAVFVRRLVCCSSHHYDEYRTVLSNDDPDHFPPLPAPSDLSPGRAIQGTRMTRRTSYPRSRAKDNASKTTRRSWRCCCGVIDEDVRSTEANYMWWTAVGDMVRLGYETGNGAIRVPDQNDAHLPPPPRLQPRLRAPPKQRSN